ncbi:3178_t:CDS:2, partial [Entrophospora sp. SA101]
SIKRFLSLSSLYTFDQSSDITCNDGVLSIPRSPTSVNDKALVLELQQEKSKNYLIKRFLKLFYDNNSIITSLIIDTDDETTCSLGDEEYLLWYNNEDKNDQYLDFNDCNNDSLTSILNCRKLQVLKFIGCTNLKKETFKCLEKSATNTSNSSDYWSELKDVCVTPNMCEEMRNWAKRIKNNNNNSNCNISRNNRSINRIIELSQNTNLIKGAVELSYGTPYLLSIGLSKSLMSLVWVAGPLSGLLMQPIVGALSDNSTSRFGRRRPFMVIGSLIVAIALMFIGWTQEIVYSLVDEESPTSLTLKKILAVFSFYLLDFAINAIQASCRALIVDSLSTSQQEEGTAWAGRMIGIGGVAGYFMGFIDLPAVFPFLGGTQLQVLCALASIILLSSIGITCWTISEKVLQRSDETKNPLVEAFEVLATIIKSFRNLPRTVRLL